MAHLHADAGHKGSAAVDVNGNGLTVAINVLAALFLGPASACRCMDSNYTLDVIFTTAINIVLAYHYSFH